MDEDDDAGWDQRSDFSKLEHTGYRNGILGEFEESESEGRIAGFQSANMTNSNPTYVLSRLDGLVTACLLKLNNTLTEEQKQEAHAIQKDIKEILNLFSRPPSQVLQEYLEMRQPDHDCNCVEKNGYQKEGETLNVKSYNSQCQSIIIRAKAFCDATGWKMPECCEG